MSDLAPLVPLDAAFPPKTAFMARTDLTQTRLLGYRPVNQDAVTTLMMGLLNHRPTVRHRSGVTEPILRTFARAGLVVAEEIMPYDTADQAEAAAERLIGRGYRLVGAYPYPDGRYPDAAMVVPNTLWHQLNSKENLHQIVPYDHLLARQTIAVADVGQHHFGGPVWLKAAGNQATGWGFAVRYCKDRAMLDAAVADFALMPGVTHLIAEADGEVAHSWCANVIVAEAGTIYAGFAEQEFASPGRQSGSVIDPEHPFPMEGQRLAVMVGEAARTLGFRGLAGFDIGQTPEGRFVVFDPNFRFNSSTPQAIFHASAAARIGWPASRSFHVLTGRPCGDAIERILPAIDAGWFVPTRLLDGALLPAAEGKTFVTGFVLGNDLDHARTLSQDLQSALSE
jgi:hypothetical protein